MAEAKRGTISAVVQRIDASKYSGSSPSSVKITSSKNVSVTRVLNKSLRAAQSSVFASTWVGADNVYVSPDGSHAAFAWGAAGKEIAVAAAGSLAALNKDSPVIRAHSKEVYDMSWSAAQSGLLVSGSADGLVRLWNVPSVAQLADLPELKPLRSLSAAAASSSAASAAASLSPVVTPALSRVYSVDTHPTDANCLAAASVEAAEHLISLWDVERSHAVTRLTGHTDSILSVRWSALGRTLLSCSKDRFVHAYDPRAAPHAPIARVCAHDSTLPSRLQWLNDATAGSDSHLFVTAGYNKARALCVALWDMRALSSSSSSSSSSSEPLFVRQVPVGGNNCVGAPMLAWSAPHRLLTVAHKGDKHMYFFDLATASASSEPHIYYLNQFASDQQQLGFAGRFAASDASAGSGGASDGHSELLRVFQIFEDRSVNVLRVTRSALSAAKDASAAAAVAAPPSAAATAIAQSLVDPAAALVKGRAASLSDSSESGPISAANPAPIPTATVVGAWDEQDEVAYETRHFAVRESVAALPRMLRQSTIFDLAPMPIASSAPQDEDAEQPLVESSRTVRFHISPAPAVTSDMSLAGAVAQAVDNNAAAGVHADSHADSSELAAAPSSSSSSFLPPSDVRAVDTASVGPSSSSSSSPVTSEPVLSSCPIAADPADPADHADDISPLTEDNGDDPPPPTKLPQIPPELLASIHKGCELRRVIIIHTRDPSSAMPAFAAPAPPPMPASLLRSIHSAANSPLRPAAVPRVDESNVAENAGGVVSASSLSLSPVASISTSVSVSSSPSPMASVSASPTPLQQQQLFEQVESHNHQQMQQLQTHARLSALERAAAAHRADVERLERDNAALADACASLRTQNRILAEAGGVGGGLIVAPVQWPTLPPNVARRVVTSAEDEPKGHFAVIARESVFVKPVIDGGGGGGSGSDRVRALFLSSRALPTDAAALPSAGSSSAPETASSRGPSGASSSSAAAVAPLLLMDPRRTQLSQFSRLHQLVYLRSAWPHF